MKIDFFTFIARYSADYAEFLKYTAEHFASGNNKINWKCIESVGAERLPGGFTCVAKAPGVEHNSMNHSLALNMAQDYIESDYVVFVDADVAILYRNWDEVIIGELTQYDCFGGAYNDKVKYKDFPTVYLFAFRKGVLDKIVLDFSPSIVNGVESPIRFNVDKIEASYFGVNEGDAIKCDTGWKIPMAFKRNKLTGNAMPMVSMKSDKRKLPFVNQENKRICMQHSTHMHEWHYHNHLFATHKQASRNHPITEGWGKEWKDRVELYMEE